MRVALSAQVDWKVTALKAKASVSVRATLAGWLWEVLEELTAEERDAIIAAGKAVLRPVPRADGGDPDDESQCMLE